MSKAQSKADIRNTFSDHIASLADTGVNVSQSLRNKEQRKQARVVKGDWSGDVFDTENMGKAFDRSQYTEDMRAVVKDDSSPGVVGDLSLTTMQGDWLSAAERAFRLQHLSKVRASIHAAARRYGHGHDAGLFHKGVMGYMRSIAKKSKDEGPTGGGGLV